MASCTSIDPLVTPYVDGELSTAERTLVNDHLHRCPPCQARVEAEAAVRDLVRARKASLTSDRASSRLRARCDGLAGQRPAARPATPGTGAFSPAPWRLRLASIAPIALAASLVVLIGGAFLYQATDRSASVMAAELAADHVKCFAANDLLGTHDAPAAVESSMMSSFGWHLHLPPQLHEAGLELVGARQCLYAEGRIAHIMFRQEGRPVSVFMLPKSTRPEELVEVLGHEAAIWSSGDRTFVLVTRGSRGEVQRMASYVKASLR